jgi:hypothetical protein
MKEDKKEFTERRIVIGLLTSAEYCSKIEHIWNVTYIVSPPGKKICSWAWAFYHKYKKVIGEGIDDLFIERSAQLSNTEADDIKELIQTIKDEITDNPIDVQYLVDTTEKYFIAQHLTIFKDNIDALLYNGKVEEANTLAREFKPLEIVQQKLDTFVLSVAQIRRKKVPPQRILIDPWLREGETTIIYGNWGVGKSLLTISIAFILGVEDAFSNSWCEVGEWQVKNLTGCLYLDGELGEQEMQRRIQQYEWVGQQTREHRTKILSVPEYQMATEDTFYLSDRKNQLKVITWLKEHPLYKLIILDSASTLFGLKEENDNSEWNNAVNPFLRDLRALGVACILLHHSGKDKKRGLRGASSMGAMAHNIYKLEDHVDKNIDDGEAWFILSKDKMRSSGHSFRKFEIKYTQNLEKTETSWKVMK